jgi:hypothetical protein
VVGVADGQEHVLHEVVGVQVVVSGEHAELPLDGGTDHGADAGFVPGHKEGVAAH